MQGNANRIAQNYAFKHIWSDGQFFVIIFQILNSWNWNRCVANPKTMDLKRKPIILHRIKCPLYFWGNKMTGFSTFSCGAYQFKFNYMPAIVDHEFDGVVNKNPSDVVHISQ